MKRYKIKNRLRFITFVTVMLLVVSFTFAGVFDLINVHSAVEKEYVEVCVSDGDTLWQLAKSYGRDDCDIREVVYEICSINNIKASDLRAGQTILIPVN